MVRRPPFILMFVLLWSTLLWLRPEPVAQLMADYGLFSLMGIFGAIFANATGAGGGVVFIPVFHWLEFSPAQSVATSFGIQAFGMTAGACAWFSYFRRHHQLNAYWQGLLNIVLHTGIASILGLGLTYALDIRPPGSLHMSFALFSISLGLAILLSVWRRAKLVTRAGLADKEILRLWILGLAGGMLTAWLSVGVGECLAIYLILRRYDVSLSIAAAVIVSALTVWVALPYHSLIQSEVFWPVVVFAGPGAILGGLMARPLVSRCSPMRLKLLFSGYIIVVGSITVIYAGA